MPAEPESQPPSPKRAHAPTGEKKKKMRHSCFPHKEPQIEHVKVYPNSRDHSIGKQALSDIT